MLIHEDKSHEKAEKQYQEKRLSSWEDIPKSKEAYELDKLFDAEKNEKPPRHLAILGRAGIGKSTMCQYICYQWAQDRLWKDRFDALCWIPLRQLLQAKADDSFADLVRQYCLLPADRKKISSDEISDWLKGNERTLFILDGYDEIESSLQGNLKDIIAEFMQQPYWIITSRPHAAHSLLVDRKLENVGFSQSQVKEYISKALTEDSAKALLLEIHKTPWLSAIAHVPLNLELTCSSWEIKPKTFTTMTDLYNDFTLHLLHYFLQRQQLPKYNNYTEQNFIKKYPSTLEFLEHLAWEGLHQKSIVLSLQTDQLKPIYHHHCPEDVEEKDAFEQHALALGFLRASSSAARFEDNAYEFAHLTFQEYFAARYIKNLFQNKPKEAAEIIQSHKFNPQLQVVWWFLAGLLKNDPNNLITFFALLDDPPDLIGIYAFQLKVHCLEECGWSPTLPRIQQYKNEIQDAFLPFLKDNDEDVCRYVVFMLGEAIKASPQYAQSLIDALLPLLKDNDDAVRWYVVIMLGEAIKASPNHAQSIIDAVLPLLKDKAVRRSVVFMLDEAIKASPNHAQSIIDAVLPLLKDDYEGVRRSVVDVLGKALEASPEHAQSLIDALLPLLKDKDEDVRQSVFIMLGNASKASPQHAQYFIDALLPLLKDNDYPVRLCVVNMLGEAIKASPNHAQSIIDAVLPLLKDKAVRAFVVNMLGEAIKASPQHAQSIIDAVLPLLKDKDVRRSVVNMLGEAIKAIPQHAQSLIDAVLPLLKETGRGSVVDMLGEAIKANPNYAQSLIDAVLPLLKDNYFAVPRSVVDMLGKVIKASPNHAQFLIDAVLPLLEDEDKDVRKSVVHMLGETIEASPNHAQSLIDAVLPLLKDKDEDVRRSVVDMLGEAIKANPNHAQPIIDAVLPLLKDDAVPRSVVDMLGKVIKASPNHAQSLIDAVLPFLKDDAKAVRRPVIDMLGEASKASPNHAQSIIDAVLPLLKDKDVRRSVVIMLGKAIKASLSCQEIALKGLSQLTEIEPNLNSYILSYFDCKVILNFLCNQNGNKNLMVQLFVKKCFASNISLHIKDNNFVIYENGLHTIPLPVGDTLANELKSCISSFYGRAKGL